MFRTTHLLSAHLLSALFCVLIGAVLFGGTLFGQTAPTTGITLPPGALTVKITAVKGIVQFRTSPDGKWEKAIEGTELTEGAELRTGPRSAVQFMIGDDQTITLDRLGTIQILRAEFESGKVFTDLGMKYGRTRYDIESAAREHDAKVRSPSSVLAVRGTKFIAEDQPPFAPAAVSLDGRVMFRDTKKLVAFGNKGQGKTRIDADSDSAGGTALKSTIILPTGKFTGTSGEDAERTLETAFSGYQNYGVASLIAQGRLQNFPVLVVFRTLDLFFGLNWTGGAGSDVSLQVVSPLGEVVNKANPRLPSGLATYQDSPPADATGVGGTKSVTWPALAPVGKYTITTSLTTKGPVNVTVDAVEGATTIDNPIKLGPNNGPFIYTLTDQNPSNTVTVVSQPITIPGAPSAAKVVAGPMRKSR
jgi:hypothetical protein